MYSFSLQRWCYTEQVFRCLVCDSKGENHCQLLFQWWQCHIKWYQYKLILTLSRMLLIQSLESIQVSVKSGQRQVIPHHIHSGIRRFWNLLLSAEIWFPTYCNTANIINQTGKQKWNVKFCCPAAFVDIYRWLGTFLRCNQAWSLWAHLTKKPLIAL